MLVARWCAGAAERWPPTSERYVDHETLAASFELESRSRVGVPGA